MQFKKISKILVLALILAMVGPFIDGTNQVSMVQAADKVQISAAKKSIKLGESFTLKVNGTKQEILWTSSKDMVATVSKSGKVTGKSIGSAVITAKVSNKKYTCKVTVKKPNKYLKGAPFDAKEVKIGKYSIVVPRKWKSYKKEINGIECHYFSTDDKNTYIMLSSTYVSDEELDVDVDLYAELFQLIMTEDYLEESLREQEGIDADVSDLNITTENINARKMIKVAYSTYVYDWDIAMNDTIYMFLENGCITEVGVTVSEENTTPDFKEIVDYILKSFTYEG